ncbi:hypothetical protein J437_LFUL012704 [Ladona fulva]|uniref:TOG domain-containing protein n=1 Tax=Ladona fulva TaxID=123851 RepID=A0A8K0KCJ5_LADFU|nr:hypothetical protein J437_LFUL012704 [Ladona fulva]
MAVAEVAEAGKEAIQSTHPCVPEGSADGEEGKGEVEGEVVGEKGEVMGEAAVEVGEAVGEVLGGEVEAVEEVKEMVEGSVEAVIGGSEDGVKGDTVEEEVVSAGEGGGGEDVGAVVEEGERVVEEGSGNETEKKEGDEEASTVIEDEPDGSQPKSNCGGVADANTIAVPIDLSAGLLTVEIDDPNSSAPRLSPPPRPNQLNCTPAEEFPMSASFTIPNMHGKGTESSSISTSSVPPGVYSSKNHAKHQRLSLQHRENRRSMPPRNGFHKHSMPSLSSAPNVHSVRSSSMSTALFPETLPPLKNPKESMKQAFQSMDDPDWEVAMKGLEILVRLIRHHPSYVHAELTRVIATLGRQIRNLRSQVARAACQASGELALPRVSPSSPSSITSDGSTCASSLLKRALEADLEEVAAPLLHRSADTNRFLRDDCVAALDRFVAGVGPSRVVGPILSKGVTHQNALVRTVTARLLAAIVAKLGADRVMTQLNKDVRAKVLRAGANLLMEGSLQTRTFAKQVFRSLASHENFDRALTQAVPTQVLRNIHKTLLAIKKESIASNGVDPTWNG